MRMMWLLGVVLVLPSLATASIVDELIRNAESNGTARHPVWLKLLHYESGSLGFSKPASAIITEQFFLAGKIGHTDAGKELKATLLAFMDPVAEDPNAHPQCIFRARYFWLKEMLGFDDTTIPTITCPLYDEWTLNNKTESISLVFVTGYLGNPASYYGHTLLKFNAPGETRHSDLLDVSVNYGAIVPDGVNPVSYIIKGITGGYDGGFSHIKYYHHNHNYGEIELRDLWEYQLDLTPKQVALVTAHSWELLGKKFKYYFFGRNCVYRMAEILELIDGIEIIPRRRPWKIPQVIVRNVAETRIDGQPLVTNIIYYPSRQSRFYEKFEALDNTARTIVAQIVDDPQFVENPNFQQIDGDSKSRILNTLLDYYKFVTDPQAPTDDRGNVRYRQILAKRFSLPVERGEKNSTPRGGPHASRPPSLIRVSAAYSSQFDQMAILTIRPAYYDSLDADVGHVQNSSLRMLDTKLIVYDNKVKVRKVDLMSIVSVNAAVSGLPNDNGAAWKLNIGAEQQNLACEDCLVGRFQGDTGRTMRFGNRIFIGAYVGGALQNNRNAEGSVYAKVSGFANFLTSDTFRMRTTYEHRYHFDSRLGHEDVFWAEARFSPKENWEIRLSFEKNIEHEVSFSFGYYW